MKLEKYQLFSLFKTFESLLEMNRDVMDLLISLESSSAVARDLMNIVRGRKDLKLSQNYLSNAEANDEIKFMNDSQGKRAKDMGENPFDKKGNVAKIGRVVRQILQADSLNPTDAEIEKFVNLYKAAWNRKYTKSEEKMRFITGEEIRFWYMENNYYKAGGTLNNSCMRYAVTQDFLDIYVNNPQTCKLLIYTNDQNLLVGRALIWKLNKPAVGSEYYMDRIYMTTDHIAREMYDFTVKTMGKMPAHFVGDLGRYTLEVKLQNCIFPRYPYMDSLIWLLPSSNLITSVESGYNDGRCPLFKMRNTNGTVGEHNGWVISYNRKSCFKKGDCHFIETQLPNGKKTGDWYHKDDLAYCNGDIGTYALKDQAEYSELYKKTYLKTSLVDSQWGRIPRNSLVTCYRIEEDRVEIDISIPNVLITNPEYSAKYTPCETYDYGSIYVRKSDCIPPLLSGGNWTTKSHRLRNSRGANVVDLYRVDLPSDIIIKDRHDEIGYEIVDEKIKIKSLAAIYISDGIYSVTFKTEYSEFPFGVKLRDGGYYCTKEFIEYFKIGVTEDCRYWGKNNLFRFVFRKIVYAEVRALIEKYAPSLVGVIHEANSYCQGSYSDYNNLQNGYKITKSGGPEKFLLDYFEKSFNGTGNYGRSFESTINLELTQRVSRNFSGAGSYIFMGKNICLLNSEELLELFTKYKKEIFLYAICFMLSGGDGDRTKSDFKSLVNHRYIDLGISEESKNLIVGSYGVQVFSYMTDTDNFGNLARFIRALRDHFSLYLGYYSNNSFDLRTTIGINKIINIFNQFWLSNEKPQEIKEEDKV